MRLSWKLALSALVLSAPVRPASGEWIRISTSHFELYTTAGEKKGREAIRYFEHVRRFFLEASPARRIPQTPVRIVAFHDDKQFRPYTINEAAFAYYTGARGRDWIVMQDIVAEHFPAALHEYTHLILRHSGLRIPLWLDEGMAELYSTLRPMSNKLIIGDLIPGRMVDLQQQKWLDVAALVAVTHDSPYYNEQKKAGIFYAESWALTHMLVLSPAYRLNFAKFLAELSSGTDFETASRKALGAGAEKLDHDLHFYLTGHPYGVAFDLHLKNTDEDLSVDEVPAFDADLMLADLSVLINKRDEASAVYRRLLQQEPDRPEIEASLGYLALLDKEPAEARRHFAKAFAEGSKDAQMCLDLASLELSTDSTSEAAVIALKRALLWIPDNTQARLLLGETLNNRLDYRGAVEALKPPRPVNLQGDEANEYLLNLAYAYLAQGDVANARQYATEAKKWAVTPDQVSLTALMMSCLNRASNKGCLARFGRQESNDSGKAHSEAPHQAPPI